MSVEQKRALWRVVIGGVLLAGLMLFPWPVSAPVWVRAAAYLVPCLLVGGGVFLEAAHNIGQGEVFDENFLMALAAVGAFACGEYPEGVAVLLFYQVGELFQSVAVDKSRRSISNLMDIRPDSANVERGGVLVSVAPEEVAVGDVIVVRAGERVPLDGVVLDGASALDTAALTGESLPRDVAAGDEVVSGCVNLSGVLRVKVSKPYGESTVAKILDLVENSSAKKAEAEHFITKFARRYTPVVVVCAVALAVVPSLFDGQWSLWVPRALNFLVVSCPCALVISIPLSFFGGIGGASRRGILVKGGNYLEALAKTGVVVFDKTGTLTEGAFSVSAVHPVGMSEEALLELAALAERFSSHPIARSVQAACRAIPDPARASDAQELAGLGVQATVDGKTVWAGNTRLMERAGAVFARDGHAHGGTVVHVAVGDVYAGHIVISDVVRPEAAQALRELKALGVRQTVMLTGDAPAAADAVGRALGLDQVCAQLLPADKVSRVEELLARKRSGEQLVFVGDGINDAPVLSRADVGVAMGALGSDAAIEAADIVLMDDNLSKLPAAVSIARKTVRIVRQNVIFALSVKFLVLGLSALGLVGLWSAVFADVGVSVLAVLNAGRMLR